MAFVEFQEVSTASTCSNCGASDSLLYLKFGREEAWVSGIHVTLCSECADSTKAAIEESQAWEEE